MQMTSVLFNQETAKYKGRKGGSHWNNKANENSVTSDNKASNSILCAKETLLSFNSFIYELKNSLYKNKIINKLSAID